MSLSLGPKPHFLSAWLRNPLQVGAVLPSSNALARAMAARVPLGSGLTVELGAGTGAVTGALLARGVRPDHLIAVEKDIKLAAQLARRFPGLQVLAGDAAHLRPLLGIAHTATVDSVVSSLPLLSMRTFTRTRILAEIVEVLVPDGCLVQFTYSPKPPIPASLAEALGVSGERVSRVLRNVPPANVWVYTKQARVDRSPLRGGANGEN